MTLRVVRHPRAARQCAWTAVALHRFSHFKIAGEIISPDKTFFFAQTFLILRTWHLNRNRRSTRFGRNTPGRFRVGMTSCSRAGWRRRSASSKAARGDSRIRSSAPTNWRRKSRTKKRSGTSGWPRHRHGLRGIAVLPRAIPAAAHTRRARIGLGLSALQRNARAVRGDCPPKSAWRSRAWAQEYEPVHAVAHWDDRQRRGAGNYDAAFENAAEQAELLLARVGRELAPKLLHVYPTIVWEDQDECLEVRPEDVPV